MREHLKMFGFWIYIDDLIQYLEQKNKVEKWTKA